MEAIIPWLQAFWSGLLQWYPVALPVLIPLIVQAGSQYKWPSRWRMWIAVGASTVSGVLAWAILPIAHSPENLALLVPAFILGTQGAYDLFKANGVTCRWLEDLLKLGSKFPPSA